MGTPANTSEPQGAFTDHLEELRKRLLWSVGVFVLAALSCYTFSDLVLEFLIRPLHEVSQKVYFLSPFDAFLVRLQATFWSALFFVSPFFFTELWLFVAPGLYDREKRIFLTVLLSSVTLFLMGGAIAIFFVIPATVRFFLGFSTPSLEPLLSVERYLSFTAWMATGFGFMFQVPVALIGLVQLGVLRTEQIARFRRCLIAGIFIFSALITPSPDPFSQCLLALPLWLLFETSLLIAALLEKRLGIRKM